MLIIILIILFKLYFIISSTIYHFDKYYTTCDQVFDYIFMRYVNKVLKQRKYS